ncbi:MAG: calcium/sodium antiporter [Candidatus Komeilibacteria bacterium]|nr:calcium/sodium antiporter [Candidatus Komeilibacteria bacterium]
MAVLIKAADYFTEAAEKIGLSWKMPPLVVGVTIVAIGTALPELATSLVAVFNGQTQIVAANALGSNITNIFLIIGICAISAGVLKIKKSVINANLPLLAAAVGLIVVIMWDRQVTFGEGVVAILAYLIYAVYLVESGKYKAGLPAGQASKAEGFIPGQDLPATRETRHYHRRREHFSSNPSLIFALIVSALAIYLSAAWTVRSLLSLADMLKIGVSVAVMIALAIGTSLPVLIVSLLAVKKKQYEIALGTVFGANIFNALMILGIPSLFKTLIVDEATFSVGIPFLVGATLIYIISIISKKIDRLEGGLYLLIYALFVAKLIGLF